MFRPHYTVGTRHLSEKQQRLKADCKGTQFIHLLFLLIPPPFPCNTTECQEEQKTEKGHPRGASHTPHSFQAPWATNLTGPREIENLWRINEMNRFLISKNEVEKSCQNVLKGLWPSWGVTFHMAKLWELELRMEKKKTISSLYPTEMRQFNKTHIWIRGKTKNHLLPDKAGITNMNWRLPGNFMWISFRKCNYNVCTVF